MKKKSLLKRGIASLLAVILVAGLIPMMPNNVVTAYAAENDAEAKNSIGLGTSNIGDPQKHYSSSVVWTGSYVYFGDYDEEPVKYRVLDSDSSGVFSDTTTMLLDCDSALEKRAFDNNSNDWANSDLRTYLNGSFFRNSFSELERNAIVASTKAAEVDTDGISSSAYEFTPLKGEKIFVLDAGEAQSRIYGYYSSQNKTTCRKKTKGSWWLRSNNDMDKKAYVGYIDVSGDLTRKDPTLDVGVSPAFNVNLSSVLLSSASGTSKSSALTAVGTTEGTEWKLTLSDTGKTVKITADEKVTKASDGTITVPYTYTDTATTDAEKVNQISVMITDQAYTEAGAKILYYGALQGVNITASSGTGTFVLPTGLNEGYHIYILAEHVNANNATDYASTPVEITDQCIVKVSSVNIAVNAPTANNALDTDLEVTGDVASPVVKWYNGDTEVTGNAGYNTAYTVNVTLTAKDGYVFTDNTNITINGNPVTVTENPDGTVTVSYTFPSTGYEGTITHTAKGYEGTYDGESHGITVSVTEPEGVTISYSTDNSSYSEDNPTFTEAETYTVYYKIEKANYETVEGSETVKIAKRDVAVTAEGQHIVRGNSIDQSKYTVTGLLEGHKIDAVTLTPSTSEVTANGTITASVDKILNALDEDVTANYEIGYTSGKLIIEAPEAEKTVYEILEGANSGWKTDSTGNLTIRGAGEYDSFVGVKVDGSYIDSDNYTVASGSTIVTLKNAYLKTLAAGTHTFEMVWADGKASTSFTVEAAAVANPEKPNKPNKGDSSKETLVEVVKPEAAAGNSSQEYRAEAVKTNAAATGDSSHILLWGMLVIVSGLAAAGFYRKKKNIGEK